MKQLPRNTGMLPIKPDPRDAQFTRIAFGAPVLPQFPKTLGRIRKHVKNQRNTLSCTKQTTELASEYQEGFEFSAAWAWAQYCKKINNKDPQGADPRIAMGINCESGSVRDIDALYHFETDPLETIANWNNWPAAPQAEEFRKAAYIHIPLVGDYFDSVRSQLLHGQKKGQVVMAFGRWLINWNTAIIPTVEGSLNGYHAYTFIDFDTINGVEYLIAQNSYGPYWGAAGFQYFPREVINREFAKFGTGLYVFEDLTPDQINLAKQDTAYGRIQRAIIALWWAISQSFGSKDPSDILERLRQILTNLSAILKAHQTQQDAPQTPPVPAPTPVPPPPHNDRLDDFCVAIRDKEGWFRGSRSYRNNNPGNCRYSSKGYLPMYGNVGKDQQNFAIFKDYNTGYTYLRNLIRSKSASHPTWTILDYVHNHAPASDGNDPEAYAEFVAKRLGVPVDTPLRSLLA